MPCAGGRRGAASVSGDNSVVLLEMMSCLEAKAREPSAEWLGAGRGAEGSTMECVPGPASPTCHGAGVTHGHLRPTHSHLVLGHLLLG